MKMHVLFLCFPHLELAPFQFELVRGIGEFKDAICNISALKYLKLKLLYMLSSVDFQYPK